MQSTSAGSQNQEWSLYKIVAGLPAEVAALCFLMSLCDSRCLCAQPFACLPNIQAIFFSAVSQSNANWLHSLVSLCSNINYSELTGEIVLSPFYLFECIDRFLALCVHQTAEATPMIVGESITPTSSACISMEAFLCFVRAMLYSSRKHRVDFFRDASVLTQINRRISSVKTLGELIPAIDIAVNLHRDCTAYTDMFVYLVLKLFADSESKVFYLLKLFNGNMATRDSKRLVEHACKMYNLNMSVGVQLEAVIIALIAHQTTITSERLKQFPVANLGELAFAVRSCCVTTAVEFHTILSNHVARCAALEFVQDPLEINTTHALNELAADFEQEQIRRNYLQDYARLHSSAPPETNQPKAAGCVTTSVQSPCAEQCATCGSFIFLSTSTDHVSTTWRNTTLFYHHSCYFLRGCD